jgi:hypothetical protein
MSNEQNQSDASAHPVHALVMCLTWSENFPPNNECSYDHCYSVTPFGRFLLTWKSWKNEPWQDMGITFDDTPWGEFFVGGWRTIEQAKAAAQAEFSTRVGLCLTT